MGKKTFFFKKMHFFCLKYLVYKEFLVILQTYFGIGTNNSHY